MKSIYYRITGPLAQFVTEGHGYIAAALLATMFGLGIASMIGNSAIVDEVAHIPAGYSYLHYGDYRLNPEHPPLIKDLAGLPLQFMNLKFPDNEVSWTTDVNGQWESGWNFLYHIGNNADQILFWARLPILLLAIVFGLVLYLLCLRRWGVSVALVTLFFYAFSPNILAHASLVTTDLGASVFIFLALFAYGRYATTPTKGNFLILSLALAGAQLAKFSAVLLYPFLGLLTLAVMWVARRPHTWLARFNVYMGGFIGASAVSVLWIWLFYIPHTINMPKSVQDRLITGSLYSPLTQAIGHVLMNVNGYAIMKPLAQYVLGLAMVYGRVTGGNVTYFNGQVTAQSFHSYFPELFLVKTQVALLLLIILAVVVAVMKIYKLKPSALMGRFKTHLRGHALEWTLGSFASFYFLVSVAGNLNLGIRHILPIYVPIFVLVAVSTVKLLRKLSGTKWVTVSGTIFGLLMVWYAASTVIAAPNFLSYFNELIGGPANSSKYFSDSSVDWGQDLRRLKVYVSAHPEINHIAVDYFGGGVPEYYFCQRKFDEQGQLIGTASGYDCSNSVFEPWHSQYGKYDGQYIAVSETFLENDIYYSEVNQLPGYQYLRDMKPIAKIGYSIFVYKLY